MKILRKTSPLSMLNLAMINIAMMISLQILPESAEYGYRIIFYTVMGCICFFIPLALVTCELASTWPKKGGVFLWVTEAFGAKWGFVAVFIQWIENLVFFPASLAFMATAIAYLINPELDTNKLFVLSIIWIAIWTSTLLNCYSMKLSSACSSSGAILGNITPACLLIILGIIYIFSGRPVAISFSMKELIPELSSITQLTLLAGVMMSFTRVEMSAAYIADLKGDRKKSFVKAMLISCIVTIFLYMLAPLSISMVVPVETLSLSAGVMQGFEDLFTIHEKKWATPFVVILLAYGVLTSVVALMASVAKAIKEPANKGYLPRFMQKESKGGMPVGILITQGIISSILSLVVLFAPSVSSAFWMMIDLAVQIYLIMYILVFASALKLRYSQPYAKRYFKIPGGKIGMWLVSGIALLTSIFIIILGFIPTNAIQEKGMTAIVGYIAFLATGIIIFTGMPIILYHKAENQKNIAFKKNK